MPAETEWFVGRTPAWHNIGEVVGDLFTAEEALRRGFDWEVVGVPISAQVVVNNEPVKIGTDEWIANVRQNPTTKEWEVVGVVTPSYEIVNNHQAFQFADEVVGSLGGAHYDAVVALRRGRQVCMTIDTGAIYLDPSGIADKIRRYILLTNSFDGSLAFSIKNTNVRVVCANTLAMSLREAEGGLGSLTTKHTRDILQRAEMAKRALKMYHDWQDTWCERAETMIHTEMRDDTFERIVQSLFVVDGEVPDRGKEAANTIRGIYLASPTCQTVRGTAWGALQSVTEWNDWYTTVRGGKVGLDEARLNRQVNDPAGIKQAAWDRMWDWTKDNQRKVVAV
jgi:phage/plasmid-like protein (TIGR03299 family)